MFHIWIKVWLKIAWDLTNDWWMGFFFCLYICLFFFFFFFFFFFNLFLVSTTEDIALKYDPPPPPIFFLHLFPCTFFKEKKVYLFIGLILRFLFFKGYTRNPSSLSPRGYTSASTPQHSGYGSNGGMSVNYGAVPMSSLSVSGSPGFNSASPNSSPYACEF